MARTRQTRGGALTAHGKMAAAREREERSRKRAAAAADAAAEGEGSEGRPPKRLQLTHDVTQFSSQFVCRICTPLDLSDPAEVHPLPKAMFDFGKLGALCNECLKACSKQKTHPLSGEPLGETFGRYADRHGVWLNPEVVAAFERRIAADCRVKKRCTCGEFEIDVSPETWPQWRKHLAGCRDAQADYTAQEAFDLLKMTIDDHHCAAAEAEARRKAECAEKDRQLTIAERSEKKLQRKLRDAESKLKRLKAFEDMLETVADVGKEVQRVLAREQQQRSSPPPRHSSRSPPPIRRDRRDRRREVSPVPIRSPRRLFRNPTASPTASPPPLSHVSSSEDELNVVGAFE